MELNSLSSLFEVEGYLIPFSLSLLLLIAIGVVLVVTSRLRRLEKRYRVLLGADQQHDTQQLLLDYIRKTDELGSSIGRTQAQLDNLEVACVKHIQHVGVVRYDAFDDVGGALSFSIALLDASGDGVVVTGMTGRYETRMYAKPVKAGRSVHVLSNEEIQAIARAIEGYSDPRGS